MQKLNVIVLSSQHLYHATKLYTYIQIISGEAEVPRITFSEVRHKRRGPEATRGRRKSARDHSHEVPLYPAAVDWREEWRETQD